MSTNLQIFDPVISFFAAGGVFIRKMVLPTVGSRALSHKHVYDHFAVLTSGRVAVTVEGETKVHENGAIILVKAHQHHAIVALSDDVTWLCIHRIPESMSDAEALMPGAIDTVTVES